jgi:hypothetical protein
MRAASRLEDLASRWSEAQASERANAQSYLGELAEALGVSRPAPSGCGYQFELPMRVVNADGTETAQFADLFKADCFELEAKDEKALVRDLPQHRFGHQSGVPFVCMTLSTTRASAILARCCAEGELLPWRPR